MKIDLFQSFPTAGVMIFKGNGMITITFNENYTYDIETKNSSGETSIESGLPTSDFGIAFFPLIHLNKLFKTSHEYKIYVLHLNILN